MALCKNAGMEIVFFDPGQDLLMTVEAIGWGWRGFPARVTFKNDTYGLVEIIQYINRGDMELDDAFYSKLNPKNIVEFLRSSLISP